MAIDDPRLSAAARRQPAQSAAAAGRLRYPCACVRAGGSLSLRGRSQLHAARCAAGKISRHARYLGFARGVLVQGSAHGRDNSAMLDALARQPDRLRGVAVADADVSPRRSARVERSASAACASIISSATGNCIIAAACRCSEARDACAVMAELGWHLQLWIDVKDLPETIPVLKSLGLPVVIDHMGRTDARAGTGTRGLSEPVARGRRGLVLGQAVGRASAQPATRRIIPTRGRFMRRWCRPIRSGWYGAATGRIRASRARCPMPGTARIVSDVDAG